MHPLLLRKHHLSKLPKILLISSNDTRGGISVFVSQLIGFVKNKCSLSLFQIPAKKTFLDYLQIIFRVLGLFFTRFDTVLLTHINYVPLLKVIRFKSSVLFVHGIEIDLSQPISLTKTDIVFANSKRTATYIQKFGVRKIEQSYYPSQFSHLDVPLPKKNFDRVTAMFVARLRKGERYKGISSVIQAFELLATPHSRFDLQIFGDHQYNVHKSSHIHNIQVFGFVDFERLKMAYENANLFIMPSSQEGQGLVYLEALQFGVPVIALQDSPASEFIENGVNGELLSSDSKEEIVQAVHTIVDNPKIHAAYCESAYRSFHKLDIQHTFNQTLSRILK